MQGLSSAVSSFLALPACTLISSAASLAGRVISAMWSSRSEIAVRLAISNVWNVRWTISKPSSEPHRLQMGMAAAEALSNRLGERSLRRAKKSGGVLDKARVMVAVMAAQVKARVAQASVPDHRPVDPQALSLAAQNLAVPRARARIAANRARHLVPVVRAEHPKAKPTRAPRAKAVRTVRVPAPVRVQKTHRTRRASKTQQAAKVPKVRPAAVGNLQSRSCPRLFEINI